MLHVATPSLRSIFLNLFKTKVLLFTFVLALNSLVTHGGSIGFIGDSFALGTASHPDLKADIKQLAAVMSGDIPLNVKEDSRLVSFGVKDNRELPQLLWPSIREFYSSIEWVYAHLMGAFMYKFLNTPQYAWSYLVGRKKQSDPKNIYIAADLNAGVEDIPRLIDRLLQAKKEVPEQLFIFMTKTDVCSSSLELMTGSESFGDTLFKGFEYLVRNGKVSAEGTKVYVPYFLPLTQMITKESLLQRKIGVGTSSMSCQDFHKNGFQVKPTTEDLPLEALYLSALLPKNHAGTCPTLFGQDHLALSQVSFFGSFDENKRQAEVKKYKAELLSSLATRIRNFREQTSLAVDRANKWAKEKFPEKKISFHIIKGTGDLEFEGTDLAEDCFHLSLDGQIKVANAVLKEI